MPEVRGRIPADVSSRSTPLGLAVFAIAAGLYALTFWGALTSPSWPLQVLCAIANGLFSVTIFVVGHDACHGSLTSSNLLNNVLGRLSFLPSLTPYTSWEYAHNRLHHSYTNLRPRDYVWAPLSKHEYDALPAWRRALERHYRSVPGLGTYYLVEIWWRHLLFPGRSERQEMKRPVAFALDWLLVAAFAVAQFAVIFWVARSAPASSDSWGPFTSAQALVINAWLVPFLLWKWLMGFAIYQQHNHQEIAWYNKREEWDFFAAQVESTVRIELPWYLDWISGRIMHHTAHHVNPRIPLYRLPRSQQCLERAYPIEIVVRAYRVGTLSCTMSLCKLYDFENHRWLNFAGQPTTPPHPLIHPAGG